MSNANRKARKRRFKDSAPKHFEALRQIIAQTGMESMGGNELDDATVELCAMADNMIDMLENIFNEINKTI